jgi:hypothetical protein
MVDPPVTELNALHPAARVILLCLHARGAKLFSFDAEAIVEALDDAGWLCTDGYLRTVRADAIRDAATGTARPCRDQLLARADAIEAGAGPSATPDPRGRHRAT